jgi:hypothetical protein
MMRAALGSTIKFFPDLPALANNAAWIEATRRLGAMATYGQAFLAIDWLVEQYGSAKLLEFLGRFALDVDPREHWRTVFPISYRQFVDEFRARLEGLGRPAPPAGSSRPAISPKIEAAQSYRRADLPLMGNSGGLVVRRITFPPLALGVAWVGNPSPSPTLELPRFGGR